MAAANDTEYGLSVYLRTREVGRTLSFSRKVESGGVIINGAGTMAPQYFLGGWKRKTSFYPFGDIHRLTVETESGQRVENGKEAILDWTQLKTVMPG